MTEISEFVTLVDHEDYEILTTFPHTIRRKDNHHIIKEYVENDGYLRLNLNGKLYQKHRLIASQFIDNSDNLPNVDHINHDRADNRIENLRWVSRSDNSFNKSSAKGVQYEFVDDIPDEAIKILFYETRTAHYDFEEDKYYYYHDDENDDGIFYSKMTDTLYRIMHININKENLKHVSMRDITNKRVYVYINKLKRQYSLD